MSMDDVTITLSSFHTVNGPKKMAKEKKTERRSHHSPRRGEAGETRRRRRGRQQQGEMSGMSTPAEEIKASNIRRTPVMRRRNNGKNQETEGGVVMERPEEKMEG